MAKKAKGNRVQVILECTEQKATGVPGISRYITTKNKRFWSEEEQRYITLKVSCKGMRIIEKNGLEATLRDAQKKGLINLV